MESLVHAALEPISFASILASVYLVAPVPSDSSLDVLRPASLFLRGGRLGSCGCGGGRLPTSPADLGGWCSRLSPRALEACTCGKELEPVAGRGDTHSLPLSSLVPLRACSPHPPATALPVSAPCPRQPAPGHRRCVGTWEPRPCDQAEEARALWSQSPVPPWS